jgi:hypothetical protein
MRSLTRPCFFFYFLRELFSATLEQKQKIFCYLGAKMEFLIKNRDTCRKKYPRDRRF